MVLSEVANTTSPRRAVAHTREFLADSLTPLALYRRLAEISPVRFLFESVTGGEQVSRFSFLGAGPRRLVRLYADRVVAEENGRLEVLEGGAIDALRSLLGSVRGDDGPVPFTGGWVGFFGYDLVRLIERLPNRPEDPFGLPIAVLGRFDTVLAFDHARQRVLAVANAIEGEVSVAEARADLDRLEILLREGAVE